MAGKNDMTTDEAAWTPVEKAYSAWLYAAREKAGDAGALAREVERHLRKSHGLSSTEPLSGIGVGITIDGRAIRRWERGEGSSKKKQPRQPPAEETLVKDALIAVVTQSIPVPPVPMAWVTFTEVWEAFAEERRERQGRGSEAEQQRAIQERDAARHQFLAVWPTPAKDIDPLVLGLGSWAFQAALPPYVPRTSDAALEERITSPGITVVTGPPKSGKSRSILWALQQTCPNSMVWWANPAPAVLPLLVEGAKAAFRKDTRPEERPRVIILDDADLLGTDPATGLTAQRLQDLAATGAHIILVIHDQALARWRRQLTHRRHDKLPNNEHDLTGLGASHELMNLLRHSVRYHSLLDGTEASAALTVYKGADQRIETFDMTRLGESLAGVQALRDRAHDILADPTSVEAALLEAAVDGTIVSPEGMDIGTLYVLAQAHYRRRQPNRPLRPAKLEQALDTLTTGLAAGSPHAILTAPANDTYRLLDALTPELQRSDRNTDTLIKTISRYGGLHEIIDLAGPGDDKKTVESYEFGTGAEHKYLMLHVVGPIGHKILSIANPGRKNYVDEELMLQTLSMHALHRIGQWHFQNNQEEQTRKAWTQSARSGDMDSLVNLGVLAIKRGDVEEARKMWEGAVAWIKHPGALHNLDTLRTANEN